jgi:hypothetical protein
MGIRRHWPTLLLILSIVVPYHRLLFMQAIIVTDDRIVSDVYHAEFPARVEMARLIHGGELPLWSPRLCTGMPLHAGMFPDPLSLLTFGFLPSVAALNVFLLTTLIAAALGAAALARRFGASELGGVLAGVSFSWSGYMVCQLKHLGIVSVVCWLPLGLWLLDRALSERSLRALIPFALIVALQWVSNFPQSAYICSLAYLGLALAHRRLAWIAATAGAIALGIMCAAPALLPLRELAANSERTGGVTWQFATMLPYSPYDVFTFFLPYANGDASNDTYRGTGLFWENYGYVGLVTTLLAIYGAIRGIKKLHVAYLAVAIAFAYLIVLGPATPVFKVLFRFMPGMSSFRFPTRFLVVVDLGLAVLGGIGLTYLEKSARSLGIAAVAITTADLIFHHRRQNPLADARSWMAEPATATFIKGHGPGRIYTPLHYRSHSDAFTAARGWSDLSPYFAHRSLLQPNTNVLWGLDTCDCYGGLLPATSSIVWGRAGNITNDLYQHGDVLEMQPRVSTLLKQNGVRYVLSRWRIPTLQQIGDIDNVRIYLLDGVPRVRVEGGTATIVSERSRELVIDANAPAASTLVLADQYYPGWHATVDGAEVPIALVHERHRAIALPAGQHRVVFRYRSESFVRGLWIGSMGLLTLLGLWLRSRPRTSSPPPEDDRSDDSPSPTPA